MKLAVTGLRLQHFRCHVDAIIHFQHPVTIFVGRNGAGKTSYLEAIRMISTGKSFRTEQASEVIQFDQELARIELEANDRFELIVTTGQVQGKRTVPKLYRLNGAPKTRAGFVAQILTVVFRPEDLRLMEGSPARRRQFLDELLSLAHPEYDRALLQYEQTLRRRNKVLEQIRDQELSLALLPYWNQQLVTNGVIVQQYRRQWLEWCSTVEFPLPFQVTYLPSLLSTERLSEYQDREVAAGHTLIGPQKDDVNVLFPLSASSPEPRSIMTYGSRGQQRLAVIWLKWCECQYLVKLQDLPFVLLFDDVFSELDQEARTLLIPFLHQNQSVLTSADEYVVEWLSKNVTAPIDVQHV